MSDTVTLDVWGNLSVVKGPTKICARCSEEKPLEEFTICNTTPRQIHRKRFCKVCYAEMQKERTIIRKSAPPKTTRCELCGKEAKMYMDHCHTKLVFRGWICNDCNTGLGKFHDDVELLEKAISYLERSK